MRIALISLALLLVTPPALEAAPAPRPNPTPKAPEPKAPEPEPSEQVQREADRHFRSGVALFKEAKYGEALVEFERAYEIAPHPLVLYNIAGCQRELSRYAEAIASYNRFLAEGNGKVPAARMAAAQVDLEAVFALIGRVTVTITPATDGATLIVDGTPLDKPVMPLILLPGEHRLVARAAGRSDAERTLKVAAGDALTFELPLNDPAVGSPGRTATVEQTASPLQAPSSRASLAVDAGFGMNLRRFGKTGAPSIGLVAEIGSRLGVGVDAVLVAYAVIPSIRVRLVGDALSLHVVGAVPISFTSDPGTFVAVAGGLGLRYRATPRLAFRLESYVSVPSKNQDMTVPTFLGGELWF